MLTIAVVLIGIAWDPDDWVRWQLILLLAAVAVAGAIRPVSVGPVSLDTQVPAVTAVVGLAGPAPAAALGLLSSLVGDVGRKPPHYVLLNVSVTLLWTVTVGLLVEGMANAGWFGTGEASRAVAVLPAGMVGNVLNFACLLPVTAFEGIRPRDAIRTGLWPVVPFEILGVLAGALTVALYEVADGLAVAGLAVAVGALIWTLALLGRAELRAVEVARLSDELLSAGERERRRLAAALHDDALQRLSVARQDLADGLAGDVSMAQRAYEDIAEAVRSLRALMVQLDTAATPASDLDTLISAVVDRSELTVEANINDTLSRDETVIACVAELLRNVVKHAQARRVWVTVSENDKGVLIEVADDGVGEHIDLHRAVTDGHLGLALVARRAHALHGDLTISRRLGGGLQARVSFRRKAPLQ